LQQIAEETHRWTPDSLYTNPSDLPPLRIAGRKRPPVCQFAAQVIAVIDFSRYLLQQHAVGIAVMNPHPVNVITSG
jgi:hypothetical protein